jgi:hypothetical protein
MLPLQKKPKLVKRIADVVPPPTMEAAPEKLFSAVLQGHDKHRFTTLVTLETHHPAPSICFVECHHA